jgi:hypothetical protein
MSILKPRNRVVVFRLTQDEYQDLKTASSVRGARNVSDFARSVLLTSIGRDRLSQVDQKLSSLESTLQHMAQLLEGMADRK